MNGYCNKMELIEINLNDKMICVCVNLIMNEEHHSNCETDRVMRG